MKVRFAPSPTGNLHIGNARIALLNFLYGKKHGGKFFLRIDDTDKTRSKDEYVEEIQSSLAWMGIEWDEIIFQSKRLELYKDVLEKLKADGRVYACYETQEELDFKRKLQLRQGKPPVYDREALDLTQKERESLEASGKAPYWRFLLDREKQVSWKELSEKEMKFHMSSVSDPVLVREDGVPLYTFSSVVDDGEMGITHIIRGDDHITNTAVQIQLFEALGFLAPETAHLALVIGETRKPLSKRSGESSILGIKKNVEPMALNLALCELGNSNPPKHCLDLSALTEKMNFKTLGSSSVRFNFERLDQLNKWVIRNQSWSYAKSKLLQLPVADEKAEEFWNVIRPNVDSWNHANHWYQVVFSDEVVEFNFKNCPINFDLFSLIEEKINKGEHASLLKATSAMPISFELTTATAKKHWLGKFTIAEIKAGVRWMLTGEKHGPKTLSLLDFMNPEVIKKRLSTARSLLETTPKNL